MVTLGIVLAIALLAALSWLGYWFAQFRATAEAIWRDRIASMVAATETRLRTFKKQIDEAKQRRATEVEKERLNAFHRYLSSISVEALQDYPGIGPATIDRLRQSGMVHMQLMPAHLQLIPGIGPKKEKVVKEAIQQVVAEARSRFDAGGCREAQEWVERSHRIDKALAEQIADVEYAIRAGEHTLIHLRPVMALARQVTFLGYLRKRQVAELTADLLKAPVETLVPPLPAFADKAAPAVFPPAPLPGKPEISVTTSSHAPVVTQSLPIPTPRLPIDLFRSELDASEHATSRKSSEHPRLGHLRAAANFGFAVARADGKIANSEREAIRKYLQQSFGHEADLVRWIHPFMEAAEKQPSSLEQCLTIMHDLFEEKDREGLYRVACAIVDATGKRNAKKKACLERIATAWGIAAAPSAFAATPVAPLPAPCTSSPPPIGVQVHTGEMSHDECLGALEIASNTPVTADLVRRQYRLLCERIDPAKLESHGAEFVRLAIDKRVKIEHAAKMLLEKWGEKLEEPSKPEVPKDLRHNPDLDAVFGM